MTAFGELSANLSAPRALERGPAVTPAMPTSPEKAPSSREQGARSNRAFEAIARNEAFETETHAALSSEELVLEIEDRKSTRLNSSH